MALYFLRQIWEKKIKRRILLAMIAARFVFSAFDEEHNKSGWDRRGNRIGNILLKLSA